MMLSLTQEKLLKKLKISRGKFIQISTLAYKQAQARERQTKKKKDGESKRLVQLQQLCICFAARFEDILKEQQRCRKRIYELERKELQRRIEGEHKKKKKQMKREARKQQRMPQIIQ